MPRTTYFWDEDNILAEYDENGAVRAEYTYDPQPFGNLISEERDGEFRQYHYDGLGSTIALSDQQGNVTDTCEYTAFGDLAPGSEPLPTPFQYCGRVGYYRVEDLGSFYVRRRSYLSGLGCWMSVDPIEMEYYWYVQNDPLVAHDPSGLFGQLTSPVQDIFALLGLDAPPNSPFIYSLN